MNLRDLLSIEKCNCGREYCDYYNAYEDESITRQEVEKMVEELPKVLKHLKKELAKEN